MQGSPPTREVVTTPSIYGGYSFHLVWNAVNQGVTQILAAGNLTIGVSYTLSAWVRVVSGQPLIMAYNNGGYNSAGAPAGWAGDGQWHQLTKTYTAGATSDTLFLMGSGTIGECYFGATQLEAGAFATSYIPTTTSTVTRNADVVTVPTTNWNPSTGTVITVTTDSQGFSGAPNTMFAWRNTDNDRIQLDRYFGGTYGSIRGITEAGGTVAVSGGPTIGASGYHSSVISWYNGQKVNTYIDGANNTQSSNNFSVPNSLPSTAVIGGYSGNYYYNGPIQRLTVYSSALSSSDVTTVTNAVKNGQ